MTKLDSGRPLEDLVICAEHNYSFDNRWAFTGDLVDYRTVEPWDGSQLHRKHSALKRLKVHGPLPGKPMADLLKLVSTKSRLEHLEIDTLQLHYDLPNEYQFNFLKRLSINGIKIVDRFGLEVKRSTRTIRLIDSPPDGALNRIKHLYLGSNSVDHVDPNIFRGAIRTIGFTKVNAALRSMTTLHLVELHCEQMLKFECRLQPGGFISNLISGKFGGDLRVLRFGVDKLRSTAFRPSEIHLKFLRDFYALLQRTEARRPKLAERKIFLNGVLLDLERLQFDEYKFELPLVDMHTHNRSINQLEVDTCASVVEVHCLNVPKKLELIDEPTSLLAKWWPGNKFEPLSFTGLMSLYPNLRVVIVENRDKLPLKPRAMLDFLGLCQSLTDLRLIYTGFKTIFYQQLADVNSLSTLHAFTLLEPLGFEGVRTDFAFLNSKYLRRLRTNLASRETMQSCVLNRMPAFSVFEFQFWHPKVAHLSYRHRFQKLDDDQEWDWLVEKENFLKQRSRQTLLDAVETYEELQVTFCQKNYLLSTVHWIDDLPVSSGICNIL